MRTYNETFLYTPGPVSVPHRVLDAYARPLVHHRTPEMSAILADMEAKLQWLFNTQASILPVHLTGRGALEANIMNLFSPGDEIICVCNGRFAVMVAEIADIYGLVAHRVCTDWMKAPDLSEIEAAATAHPAAKAITMCLNESSTGVVQPIGPVAAIAHAHNMLCVVDAVSIAGGYPIDFDTCGADALSFASQKCLMCTPGMAFTILNDKAWAMCRSSRMPKFFTNYLDIQKNMTGKRFETPGTTPITAVYGLVEALTMMQEEGREAVFARHAENAKATREAVQALGFRLFPANLPEENRSVTLTSFVSGDPKVDINLLRGELRKEYGLTIAGGTGKELSGKILRIGHMGNCYRRDILTLFVCMEACMDKLGWLKTPGAAISACMRVFNAR